MSRIHVAMIVLIAAFCAVPDAGANEAWPRLKAEVPRPECDDAYMLARSMFKSATPRVYAPLQIPSSMASELVLGAAEMDISGGGALTTAGGFEKLPNHGGRSVYWETQSKAPVRIVLREIGRGWRGDQYSLYLPDAGSSKSEVLHALESPDRGSSPYDNPIVEEWRPPLVFRSRSDGGKWFIAIGQPFVALDEWRVYGVRSGRYSQLCTIAFRPAVKRMEFLLPARVRELVRLLDQTIGPGRDEGTLQQTAWLRNSVQHIIANTVLRPWAVSSSDAYNSRAEVDAGLRAWAVNRPRFRIRRQILRAYTLAERDLEVNYRTTLGMQNAQARAEATRVLDILFRSHYVFAQH